MNTAQTSHWRDRPVLITGATGLLGGWLVGRLVELGADVTALVRDWVPRATLLSTELLRQVSIVRGDVRDQAELERVMGEYEVDTVFHLAAQTIVGVANRNPVATLDTNIRGDIANFTHLKDVVGIAKKAEDLSRFLKDRKPIIVTTQQKFAWVLEELQNNPALKSLRVAFLIDEAHRS